MLRRNLGKRGRSLLLLTLCILLCWLVAGCVSRSRIGSQGKGGAAAKVSFAELEEFKPVDVLLVIDQSGSMDKVTDKSGLRASAAKFFVDYLGIYANKAQAHRVGMVGFGDDAPQQYTTALSEVLRDPAAIKSRISALNLGNTNFLVAFQQADALFTSGRSYDSARQRAIIVFTDGEPDLGGGRSGPALFPEIVRYAQAHFGTQHCPIYVVAIDQTGAYWSRDKKYWESIAKAFQIGRMEDLEPVFHHIIADIIGFGWEEIPQPAVGKPTPVEIEPYLERVSFTVLKTDPRVSLTIKRPDGRQVTGDDPDVIFRTGEKGSQFETYSIANPTPGTWQLQLAGEGKVRIFKDALRIHAALNSPTSPYPRGRPIAMVASFRRRDGRPVQPIPGYPLHLSAAVTDPKGKREYVQLTPRPGTDLFDGDHAVACSQSGRYRVDLTVKGGERRIFERQVTIDAGPWPYLELRSPRSDLPMRSDISVQARLMRDGRPISARQVFDEDPSSVAIMKLLTDPKGPTTIADYMEEQQEGAGSAFVGRIASDPLTGGYHLAVRLAGKLTDGNDYRSVIEDVVFAKRKTLLDHAADTWLPLTLVAVLLLAFHMISWIRRPRLSGTLMIQGGDESKEAFLTGRKMIAGKGCAVALEGDSGIVGEAGFFLGRWVADDIGVKQVAPVFYTLRKQLPATRKRIRYVAQLIIFLAGAILGFAYHWSLGVAWVALDAAVLVLMMWWARSRSVYPSNLSDGESVSVSQFTLTYYR